MIWNALRLVALIEASMILWFTLVVLRRYRRRYLQARQSGLTGRRKQPEGRRGPRSGGSGADTDWIGLLPRHVWLVSASTLMLVTSESAVVVGNIGKRAVWYGTPFALVAFTLLLMALWTVASYENRVTGR